MTRLIDDELTIATLSAVLSIASLRRGLIAARKTTEELMAKTYTGRAIAGFSARTKKIAGTIAKMGAIAGTLALVTSPAAADDSVFPGSMCAPWTDGWTYNLSRYSPELYNASGIGLYISCPVPREAPAGAGTAYLSMRIYNPAGQTTYCTYYASNQWGSSVDSESQSSVGTGGQFMNFSGVTGSSWGAYAVVCSLPAEGWIYNYYLSEQ